MEDWINTPHWADAQERWRAFWAGELLDRPPVLIIVERPDAPPAPEEPADHQLRWCDADYLIRRGEARVAAHTYLGEALPVAEPLMAAWCPVYGGTVRYLPDTIWIDPAAADWATAPDWTAAWEDEGWRLLTNIYGQIVEAAARRCMVGLPPLLTPNDLLSMLRGGETFLMDLLTEPDRVTRTLEIMDRNHMRMWHELDGMRDRATGYSNWWPVWCPEKLRIVQSDISCMISGELFSRFILPELDALGSDVEHLFYHLDGPDAIRHLEAICSVDKIHAVQWVPGAGNPGHGLHWLDLYRRIQELGRAVWVGCSEAELPPIMKELDPSKLLLSLSARDEQDAHRLLQRVHALTG